MILGGLHRDLCSLLTVIAETNRHQPVLPVGQVGCGGAEDSKPSTMLTTSILGPHPNIFTGETDGRTRRYRPPEGYWVRLLTPRDSLPAHFG